MDRPLESIGFYTLSDARAASASSTSRLMRCELILTGRCNFKCPYCRRVGGPDLSQEQAEATVRYWAAHHLHAIRFSGGEPTLYPGLEKLVRLAKDLGIERIAISTNGSAPRETYLRLLKAGVNDLSISLDACCAEDNEKMTGGIKAFSDVVDNVAALAKLTYVTVGVVLTDENASRVGDIIRYADSLGVSDIRIIPAAQDGDRLKEVEVDPALLAKYPILAYRIANLKAGVPVRGLHEGDADRCGLVLDDMAVQGDLHYPCIIYMREGGAPIGKVGPWARMERAVWHAIHNVKQDPICSKNCLDVCVEHNRKFAACRAGRGE